ncbi:MAG: GspH/FimT family pseudopilin [Gammaproteobacteria bacterium]|nr:GspH/FimT family pseudopilin [Gammaproteobacteria bacterium]
MGIHAQKGFTLIELIIALAIASILVGVGVPSFFSAIKNSCTSSSYNGIVSTLVYARSEAVKSAEQVTVCPRGSDTACGNDWNNGLLVFRDVVRVANEATAVVNPQDTIVALEPALSCGNTLFNYASSDRTAADASARNFIRYAPDGSTDWQNGSFILCDERGDEFSRSINVVLTGDVRRGRTTAGSEIPVDVFGVQLSCP